MRNIILVNDEGVIIYPQDLETVATHVLVRSDTDIMPTAAEVCEQQGISLTDPKIKTIGDWLKVNKDWEKKFEVLTYDEMFVAPNKEKR